MKELDEITGMIVDTALQIHRDLGPGLLESVYETVLARALEKRGLHVERQKPIRFTYDGMDFEEGFRIDLLVDGRVVVELKSVEVLVPVHSKQVLTYLRLMQLKYHDSIADAVADLGRPDEIGRTFADFQRHRYEAPLAG